MPFQPTDISGCQGWWDGSQLGLADGASVSSWTDLSGFGRHLTPGSAPIAKQAIQNGLDIVRFDSGADRRLRNTDAIFRSASWTIFAVFAWGSTGQVNQQGVLCCRNLTFTGGYQLTRESGGQDRYSLEGGTMTDANANGVWVIRSIDNEATADTQFYLENGFIEDQDTINHSWSGSGSPAFTVGRKWSNTSAASGGLFDAGEIIHYDRQLSAGEKTTVFNYLGPKWLIPVASPARSVRRRPISQEAVMRVANW